jgi:hypothetical protein
MKSIFNKFGKTLAVFVASSMKSSNHQQQPITLYMIAMELENDLMKLRSRFAKGITKVFGMIRK